MVQLEECVDDPVRSMTLKIEDRPLIRTEDVWQSEAEKSLDGYSNEVMRLCATYANAGLLPNANAIGMCGRSKRGEEYARISLVVDPQTLVVKQAAFQARGTLAIIASASVAARLAEGRTLDEVLTLGASDVRQYLGELPPDRITRVHIAAEALRAAVGDYYVRQGLGLEELLERVPCEATLSCLQCQHCSYKTSQLELRMQAF